MCKIHIFRQQKSVMVTAYGLWQKWGKNLASRTTYFFSPILMKFGRDVRLGECRCARHIFRQWQKECCHGNGNIMAKMGGKSCVANYFLSFWLNSHQIWHRCLPWGVDVQDTFFDSGRKCVAMVTASLWQKWGALKGLASRTTSSVFHQFSWNLNQRYLHWSVDVQRHIFRQWQKECCHGNKAYYGKNGVEILRRELLPSFSPILMKFGTDVCLGV